jgi:hypothetical protein
MDYCAGLHNLANSLAVHHHPFDESVIPLNGIYILFEAGENAHGDKRIVQIGGHRGQDRLRDRLNEHFLTENKDRSIFRQQIGRSMLNRDHDPFLAHWDIDLTPADNRARYSGVIDIKKLSNVESKVTEHIQGKLSFVVLRIPDKEQRTILQKQMIGTVAQCRHCPASANWLGRHHPKSQISAGGMWNSQHLRHHPLTSDSFDELKTLAGVK